MEETPTREDFARAAAVINYLFAALALMIGGIVVAVDTHYLGAMWPAWALAAGLVATGVLAQLGHRAGAWLSLAFYAVVGVAVIIVPLVTGGRFRPQALLVWPVLMYVGGRAHWDLLRHRPAGEPTDPAR